LNYAEGDIWKSSGITTLKEDEMAQREFKFPEGLHFSARLNKRRSEK